MKEKGGKNKNPVGIAFERANKNIGGLPHLAKRWRSMTSEGMTAMTDGDEDRGADHTR